RCRRDVGVRRQRRVEDARGRVGDRRPARALRPQGAARLAARFDRAELGDRSAEGPHRLAAVRRRAAARVSISIYQSARPLERARGDERGQGRAQGARREPDRQHRAHDGRARREKAAPLVFGRFGKLPARIGERIGLLEPDVPVLPPGAKRPRHTFRWDLDKTYLRTEFDSITDLAKSAFETAADEHAFPGATALLRALRQHDHRVCIVSGSPTQMRQVLAAKLALDGIEYDEFVLKNNLKNILRGRFRALRAQIPYKLP